MTSEQQRYLQSINDNIEHLKQYEKQNIEGAKEARRGYEEWKKHFLSEIRRKNGHL